MVDFSLFGTGTAGMARYREWMGLADSVLAGASGEAAYSGATPEELGELLASEICPEDGVGFAVLRERLGLIARHSIQPWHPYTAAHLHTPVLLPALAGEAVLAALNQSMDSFDQAPAASVLEQKVLDWLCRLVGLPDGSGGTFTAGGTQSNYMGLLLARDHFFGAAVREDGLPADAGRFRFLCSEVAHFSVEKSAIQLGLGTRSVVKVAVDSEFRMWPEALRAEIARLRAEGLAPAVIVATAGTTDF